VFDSDPTRLPSANAWRRAGRTAYLTLTLKLYIKTYA
jgi:hypothetical protein